MVTFLLVYPRSYHLEFNLNSFIFDLITDEMMFDVKMFGTFMVARIFGYFRRLLVSLNCHHVLKWIQVERNPTQNIGFVAIKHLTNKYTQLQ